MAYRLPRLLLAAPASGNGKTTVTIALLQALLNRGLRPAAFKCGPDYIDPMFHREVLGIPGYNLDLFFTPHHMVGALLQAGGRDADIAVIEGAMGYYDGVADTDEASAYRVAAATETMTVLVLQPGGACLSLAALVQGFARFRAESRIAGIILNRCSARLHDKVAPMLERETGLPVFGLLPNLADASLGSRHLGLVTPGDMADLRGKIAVLGKHAAECVDIDKLIALAHKAPELHNNLPTVPASAEAVRIAVAWDAAFCFYYRENFELLEKLGAELVYFSPLHDAVLPENIGGLYLGGGYPELHADRLAANNTLRASLRAAIDSGLPTIAECGGFMYLLDELAVDDVAYPMIGAIPGRSSRMPTSRRFGYATLTASQDNWLFRAGETVRVHEFHYWDSDNCGDGMIASKAGRSEQWQCMVTRPNLFAGFPHLYFWSAPEAARRFVQAAARFAHGA